MLPLATVTADQTCAFDWAKLLATSNVHRSSGTSKSLRLRRCADDMASWLFMGAVLCSALKNHGHNRSSVHTDL